MLSKKTPVSVKPLINLRNTLLVMLAGIIACLAYGLYQRINTGQERLDHDTRRIEAMLTENDAKRH
jgi:hypothetical protein